jgi:hypothetical protein
MYGIVCVFFQNYLMQTISESDEVKKYIKSIIFVVN